MMPKIQTPSGSMEMKQVTEKPTVESKRVFKQAFIEAKYRERRFIETKPKAANNIFEMNEMAMKAVQTRNLMAIVKLIAWKFPLDDFVDGDNTILHYAIRENDPVITTFLVLAGMNPNTLDASSKTPLALANELHLEAISIFIKNRGGVENSVQIPFWDKRALKATDALDGGESKKLKRWTRAAKSPLMPANVRTSVVRIGEDVRIKSLNVMAGHSLSHPDMLTRKSDECMPPSSPASFASLSTEEIEETRESTPISKSDNSHDARHAERTQEFDGEEDQTQDQDQDQGQRKSKSRSRSKKKSKTRSISAPRSKPGSSSIFSQRSKDNGSESTGDSSPDTDPQGRDNDQKVSPEPLMPLRDAEETRKRSASKRRSGAFSEGQGIRSIKVPILNLGREPEQEMSPEPEMYSNSDTDETDLDLDKSLRRGKRMSTQRQRSNPNPSPTFGNASASVSAESLLLPPLQHDHSLPPPPLLSPPPSPPQETSFEG